MERQARGIVLFHQVFVPVAASLTLVMTLMNFLFAVLCYIHVTHAYITLHWSVWLVYFQ